MSLQECSNKFKDNTMAVVYRGYYKRITGKTMNFNQELLENQINNIFKYFKNVDIYICTWSHDEESDNNILSLFKDNNLNVVKYEFKDRNIKDNNFTPRILLNTPSYLICKSLEMINNTQYDFVLNMRWEMFFYKSIIDPEINLKYDKFNFYFKEARYWREKKRDTTDGVSDILYFLPVKYISHLIMSIKKQNPSRRVAVHFIYRILKDLIGEDNINFMLSCPRVSNSSRVKNKFFKLLRYDKRYDK